MIGVESLAVSTTGPRCGRAPMVHVRGLTKSFALRKSWSQTLLRPRQREMARVVDSIELSVADGECFGILGPNGAGKTTLFKILATLIRADHGTATIGGHDVSVDPAGVRRLLSPVIPEERSLNWRLSGYENLRFFAAIYRIRPNERERRVRDLLEVVGLGDTGTKMVAQYSSGMRQRLLIARALIPRPRMLLLDEPTRSLDPVATRKFHEFIRSEIIGAQGCTVLIATHSPEEALSLCDRIGIMDRGKLLAVGSPRALLAGSATDRYRLWTDSPAHSAFEALGLRVVQGAAPAAGEMDGWAPIEFELPGGPEQAAAINSSLVMRGVQVAHFERIQRSLAEYIERLVEQGRGQHD
jgi:ABC-2 type transport system ATP-binding protein